MTVQDLQKILDKCSPFSRLLLGVGDAVLELETVCVREDHESVILVTEFEEEDDDA